MFDFVKYRDVEIDLLRFIGLSMIILAHVQPPEIIFQLRAFDVPMMLFVSGLAFSGRKPDFSSSYFSKRIKRLVFPVWLFLTAYFALVLTIHNFGVDFGVRVHHIIGSYTFMDGIGFVWIIRVFLIVALLTPILLWISHNVKSDTIFCLLCLCVMCLDELLLANNIGVDNLFVREFIFYGIGYSLMFMMGLRCRKMSPKLTFLTIGVLTIGFTILQLIDIQYVVGGGISINNFKYPPRALFLSYGCLISMITLLIVKPIIRHLKINKIIIFVAQNTIWIYLYHIPLIQITGFVGINWIPRYILVYIISVMIVYIQNIMVYKFKIPFKKYLIG